MNNYGVAFFMCAGMISVQGIAKDAPFNVYIKNSSPRLIYITLIAKSGDVLLENFKITSEGKPLQRTYSIDDIATIKIEYASKKYPESSAVDNLTAHGVDIGIQNRKFDKIFVKFKIDTTKNGGDAPSLQPQEGVLSLSGRVTDDKDRYSLQNNIKKTDMKSVKS